MPFSQDCMAECPSDLSGGIKPDTVSEIMFKSYLRQAPFVSIIRLYSIAESLMILFCMG